jgi:hypothetical protein
MDPLLEFLLTITGLRLAVEGVAVVGLAAAIVSAMAVLAALWHWREPSSALM